jgi:hypothetical protein
MGYDAGDGSCNVKTNDTETGHLIRLQEFLGLISIDVMLLRGSETMRVCYVGFKCSILDTTPVYWGGGMSFV